MVLKIWATTESLSSCWLRISPCVWISEGQPFVQHFLVIGMMHPWWFYDVFGAWVVQSAKNTFGWLTNVSFGFNIHTHLVQSTISKAKVHRPYFDGLYMFVQPIYGTQWCNFEDDCRVLLQRVVQKSHRSVDEAICRASFSSLLIGMSIKDRPVNTGC